MLDALVGALAWIHWLSDPLAWLVLATFVAGSVVQRYDERFGTWLFVGGWVLFAAFWFTLVHHFVFVQKSIIEGAGSVVAVPASLYVAYLLWNGRESLTILARAIAVMGLIYFPFETIEFLRQALVESVTRQVQVLLSVLGYHPAVVHGDSPLLNIAVDPYRNTFLFTPGGHNITYTILLACTGIGSMAIFAGLIGAVRAPPRRKARALAVSIPIIYVLNLVRNVFIAVSFGTQRFRVFPDLVMSLFATNDPYKVSYYVADRLISQSLSVVALVAITYLVVRELPEVLDVIEDLLFVFTGTEYDLRAALADAPVRTDGEG
ncbi:MAG: archaeosortase A [Haloarculaceae archaeon]